MRLEMEVDYELSKEEKENLVKICKKAKENGDIESMVLSQFGQDLIGHTGCVVQCVEVIK